MFHGRVGPIKIRMDSDERPLEALQKVQFDPKSRRESLGTLQSMETLLLPAENVVPLEVFREGISDEGTEDFVNSFGERNRPPVLKPERIAFAFIEKDRGKLDKGRMDVSLPDAKFEIYPKLGQQVLRQIFPDLVAEAVGARCSVREARDSQGKKVFARTVPRDGPALLARKAGWVAQHCAMDRKPEVAEVPA